MPARRPILTADPTAARLIGECAVRPPVAGSLGWAARLGVIAGASAFCWSVLLLLVSAAVG